MIVPMTGKWFSNRWVWVKSIVILSKSAEENRRSTNISLAIYLSVWGRLGLLIPNHKTVPATGSSAIAHMLRAYWW